MAAAAAIVAATVEAAITSLAVLYLMPITWGLLRTWPKRDDDNQTLLTSCATRFYDARLAANCNRRDAYVIIRNSTMIFFE